APGGRAGDSARRGEINLTLTNLALVESVFNIPGGFRYVEDALVNRDVDLVQALIVEATLFIVVANFLADAVHAWLDPRVRNGRPL
ncbi:MAG TPA: ABC transporter permease subunit, partial [Solirubrobacteraceae bacterium]|nr:ABC transporter permease subunit [Solirubrobacteraceae bacterium]